VHHQARGIYHVAGRERISKYQFAQSLAHVFDYPADCLEVSTLAAHPLLAQRPHDMSLSVSKVSRELNRMMPDVNEGLRRLKRLGEQGWRRQLAKAVQVMVGHVDANARYRDV